MRPIFSVGRHTTANNPPPADHTAEDWRELEHRCRDVDLYTLFFGPRKHIQDLWDIIDRQRLHIERLEQQLGTSRHTKQPRTNRTAPELLATISMQGSVFEHEKQVLQHIRQHLGKSNVTLNQMLPQANQAGLRLIFHRVKQRLPCDELEAILTSTKGGQGPLVVIFMHNIISGYEHTMKAAGSNNTDTDSWQHFTQQCLLIVDMTFDETRFQWCKANLQAAAAIVQAIHTVAQPFAATPGGDRTTSNANHAL